MASLVQDEPRQLPQEPNGVLERGERARSETRQVQPQAAVQQLRRICDRPRSLLHIPKPLGYQATLRDRVRFALCSPMHRFASYVM